jgi:hypothetical protein
MNFRDYLLEILRTKLKNEFNGGCAPSNMNPISLSRRDLNSGFHCARTHISVIYYLYLFPLFFSRPRSISSCNFIGVSGQFPFVVISHLMRFLRRCRMERSLYQLCFWPPGMADIGLPSTSTITSLDNVDSLLPMHGETHSQQIDLVQPPDYTARRTNVFTNRHIPHYPKFRSKNQKRAVALRYFRRDSRF